MNVPPPGVGVGGTPFGLTESISTFMLKVPSLNNSVAVHFGKTGYSVTSLHPVPLW